MNLRMRLNYRVKHALTFYSKPGWPWDETTNGQFLWNSV